MTTYDHENMFAMTPRRVENTGKNFFIDVACGDNHSLALNSSREAFVWGSNKQGQLGHDPDMYKMIATPKKLILHEYMNSSNKEVLTTIKAKANYSVLIAESKHVSFAPSCVNVNDYRSMFHRGTPKVHSCPSSESNNPNRIAEEITSDRSRRWNKPSS